MFPGANTFVQSTYMAPSLINTASRLVDVPPWRHARPFRGPYMVNDARMASKTFRSCSPPLELKFKSSKLMAASFIFRR